MHKIITKSTKILKPEKHISTKVAIESPIVVENLPYKYVHYPNHYGTFFCFSENLDSELFFCECCKAAIENSFKLNSNEVLNKWADNKINAPLSSHFYLNKLSTQSLVESKENLIKFKNKLCHRCNLATPTLTYCHKMYGGNFKQYYGWYINQTFLRLGIRDNEYLKEYTPGDLIIELNELKSKCDQRNLIAEKYSNETNFDCSELNSLDNEFSKLQRIVQNKIENITREEFGFRKIGEGNVSETILIKIIERIYLNKQILIHHRPFWLEGLELDIFIPELKLGIEYQGQQHFYPIKAWGGLSALKQIQERDARKKEICKKQGVRLVEIDYTEPLQEKYIKEKTCA